MCDTVRRTLKIKIGKETQLNLYKVRAVPVLMSGLRIGQQRELIDDVLKQQK
jgi:hypothetical protein